MSLEKAHLTDLSLVWAGLEGNPNASVQLNDYMFGAEYDAKTINLLVPTPPREVGPGQLDQYSPGPT